MERESGHEISPLTKELLAIDNCWEQRESLKRMGFGRSSMLQWKTTMQECIGRKDYFTCL